MKKRTVTSVVILLYMLLVVAFSKHIVYPIVLALLSVSAIHEIEKVMGTNKRIAISIPTYLMAALFPLCAYFIKMDTVKNYLLIVFAVSYILLLWLMCISIFSKGEFSFKQTAEVFAITVYVTVSFTSLSLLRYLDPNVGLFAVVLVFVVSWVCDVFAYVVGMLFGKHKLIPEISPKKTVEGSIGGIVFTAIACMIYGLCLEIIVEGMTINYLILGLSGAILSVVSQLGDLTASLIKREYGVKDYGNLLPGHGGVMDRFDSVLAVSTVLFIVFLLCPPFVIA